MVFIIIEIDARIATKKDFDLKANTHNQAHVNHVSSKVYLWPL